MSLRTQPLHNAQSARHPPPRREAVAAVRQVLAPLALPRAVAVGIGLASSVAARWRAQVYSAMAFTFQMWGQLRAIFQLHHRAAASTVRKSAIVPDPR